MPTLGQPEVFLGQAPTLLAEDGAFNNESTENVVRDYVTRLCELAKS